MLCVIDTFFDSTISAPSLCRGRQSEDHGWFRGAETQGGDSGASSGRQGGGPTRRSRDSSRARRSERSQRCSSAESSEESVSRGPQVLLTASSGTSKHTPNDTQYVLTSSLMCTTYSSVAFPSFRSLDCFAVIFRVLQTCRYTAADFTCSSASYLWDVIN